MKLTLAAILIVSLEARTLAAPNAEDLYDQGQAAYNRAAYATAVEKWTQSYELSRAPGLLFNIAQASRLAGDCEQALSTYKRFVALDPDSEQRGLADDFIHELEPTCGAPTQPLPTDRVRAKPGQGLKIAGLLTGGAGSLSLVIGLGLGHHASTLGDEVTAACTNGCDWQVVQSKDAAGRRDARVGYALDAVGIAAIAGGAIQYYLGVRQRSALAVTVSPGSLEGGAVVSWSGSW